MSSVEYINVTKEYEGKVVAVKDFNLTIEDGEFIILVGPSGCGKSTMLRMLAGLEEITEGEIKIDGKVVNNVEPRDRNIAMVFQSYALYPHMNVYENMAFGLRQHKIPKKEIEKRVMYAAETLELEDLLKRKPKALSGGQRQRVALGRAIVRDPKVFLMDEPLSNLDAKLRAQMRVEITKLHQRLKSTFIYVTHDQTEAMTMGTRIVLMKDGVCQQIDSPTNLYLKPVNMFVAGFIGVPQMNFVSVKLVQHEDGLAVVMPALTSSHNQVLCTLPASLLETDLRKYLNKNVVLGLRAEALLDNSRLETGQMVDFEAKVDVVERLGSETLWYLSTEMGDAMTARIGEIDVGTKVGDRVKITIDREMMHFFDPETEEAIAHLTCEAI